MPELVLIDGCAIGNVVIHLRRRVALQRWSRVLWLLAFVRACVRLLRQRYARISLFCFPLVRLKKSVQKSASVSFNKKAKREFSLPLLDRPVSTEKEPYFVCCLLMPQSIG